MLTHCYNPAVERLNFRFDWPKSPFNGESATLCSIAPYGYRLVNENGLIPRDLPITVARQPWASRRGYQMRADSRYWRQSLARVPRAAARGTGRHWDRPTP